ncbi:cation:proton antiporter [Streptomyces sp. LN549]|uniref:cation:proton antiporter n=1 Tax=Streptomyces sp. LN549 TaxID=3112979 RepID=UPI00371164BC
MSPARLAADTVAPPAPHTLLVFLLQIGVLLGLALVLSRLARKLGLPAVAGELAAGVLLGPSVLAPALPALSAWLFPRDTAQMHLLDAVGQLGVLLLVGFTGMHLDMALARRRGRAAAGISAAGLLLPLGMGLWLGHALPAQLRPADADPAVFALFIGVAMCVSSIPVIARTLVDMRLLHRNVGQMIMVVAAIDDIAGWLLLSVVTALATTGVGAGEIATPLIHMALVILAFLTLGRQLVRRVLSAVGSSDSPGASTAVTVVLLVLAAAGAQALGFEAVLGAFLCGILIGTHGPKELTQRLEPLRTTVLHFLSPLFFAGAGLRIDLTALADPTTALWGLIALALAVTGKYLGAATGLFAGGLTRWEALALAAGINARGVIQVVIAVIGLRVGLLNTAMYSIIVLIAIITPLMAPPVLRLAARRIEESAEERLREHGLHAPEGQDTARASTEDAPGAAELIHDRGSNAERAPDAS